MIERPTNNVAQSGETTRDVQIGGIDLLNLMQGANTANGDAAAQLARLQDFLSTENGEALLQGLPALYAALNAFDEDTVQAKLKAPYGALAMALQLSSKRFRGVDFVDHLLGTARAGNLRAACVGTDCQLKGRDFVVQSNGMFDSLSKPKVFNPSAGSKCRPPASAIGKNRSIASMVVRSKQTNQPGANTNGDGECTDPGNCFGYCGYQCYLAPGEIFTFDCYRHDFCVCAYGWSNCIFSIPENCGSDCSSLWDAAVSYFSALIEAWFAFWESQQDCPPDKECTGG